MRLASAVLAVFVSCAGVGAASAEFVWQVAAPTWMPATETGFDPCRDSVAVRDSIVAIRLYVSERWSDGHYALARVHQQVGTGQPDTFRLDDSPPGRTYAAFAVDSAGNESNCPTLRTVGIPVTGVGPPSPVWRRRIGAPRWYDVQGRRIHYPSVPAAGIYFADSTRRGVRKLRAR